MSPNGSFGVTNPSRHSRERIWASSKKKVSEARSILLTPRGRDWNPGYVIIIVLIVIRLAYTLYNAADPQEVPYNRITVL